MSKVDTIDFEGLNAQELIKKCSQMIQALDEEIDDIKQDRKAIIAEAKGQGLNPKILNAVIRQLRKENNPQELSEMELYQELMRDIITPLK